MEGKSREVKWARKRRFRLLNQIFAAWSNYSSDWKLAKEEELLRQQMEYDHKLLKIAYKHYENKLAQTTFFAWGLHLNAIRREREE